MSFNRGGGGYKWFNKGDMIPVYEKGPEDPALLKDKFSPLMAPQGCFDRL